MAGGSPGAAPHIQTPPLPPGNEEQGYFNPFQPGTRVYVTLPDGRRVGFTFAPVHHSAGGASYYTPSFVTDPGVDYQLESAPAVLTLVRNRFFNQLTAAPYNPASGQFGDTHYTLLAPDGTRYLIHTEHGVQQQIPPGGVQLHYSDAGVTTSTGESIQFQHDAHGRLSMLVGPDGTQVIYQYDSAGNLAAVRNVSNGDAARYGYSPDQPSRCRWANV